MDGKKIVQEMADCVSAAIAEARAENKSIELAYRKELWLHHGHLTLSGDDGEMQCSACAKYGTMDYKHDPLPVVEQAAFKARLERTP